MQEESGFDDELDDEVDGDLVDLTDDHGQVDESRDGDELVLTYRGRGRPGGSARIGGILEDLPTTDHPVTRSARCSR